MEGRRSVIVRIVGILVIGLVMPHVMMPNLAKFGLIPYYFQMFISLMVTAILWEGNLYIVLKLQEKIPWQTKTMKRLFTQLLLSGLFSNFIVFSTIVLVCFVFKLQEFRWDLVGYHIGIATILVIMVSALYEGSYFLQQWKEALLRADNLEKENVKSKYEALKNQVNPHFLFNSLNTLSGMVMDDENDKAVDFINKLSTVYRYILQSRDKEIVDLRTEMKIVEEYIFLLKYRFEESLEIEMNIPETYASSVIPPLTLQMLIENAVKHNVVSSANPLKIYVDVVNGCIEIKNTLFLKKTIDGESTGTGLNNIKNRYQLLSNEEVVISQDDQYFVVSLPLLKLVENKEDESNNNRRRGACCKKAAEND